MPNFPLVVAAALLSLACVAFAEAPSANFYPSGTVEMKEIPYDGNTNPAQTFDLYLPPGSQVPPAPGAKTLPLLFWIHGGAWRLGIKDWVSTKYLAAEGFAVVSIGYRFSQESIFPAQIQDCNACLNFVLKNAARYGIDPKKVIIGGGSAGGHLALLIGFARGQKDWGADPTFHPRAIIDFFGPVDFTDWTKYVTDPQLKINVAHDVNQLLGAAPADKPDVAKIASPLTYLTAMSPPVLIVHGAMDPLVPLAQSRQLKTALDHAHVKNKLVIIPNAGHDGPIFETTDVRKRVLPFVTEMMHAP
ncbi:MAG: alpha/beta hydrolase fold domain-containing protein [Chthoniobacterales bacterium]